MIRLFMATTSLVLLAIWLGLFTTTARSSTDFLFTRGKEANAQISVVAIDDASLETIGRWPWPRTVQAELLARIAKAGPKVIGYDIVTDDPVMEEDNKALERVFGDYPFIIRPGNTAHVAVTTDNDGLVRELPCERSFALAIARKINPKTKCVSSNLLIAYTLDQTGIEYISARDVLSNKATLPTKSIVFVGVTSPFFHDEQQTPLTAAPMPGVLLHANAVETLLSSLPFLRMPKIPALAISAVGLLLFFLVLMRMKYIWGALWLFIFLTSLMLGNIWLFSRGILLDYFYLPVGLVLTYVTQLSYEYLVEYRKRRFISDAFGKYISPVVVNQLVKNPELLRLGGDKRELTMLFSDIRSFTTISERMDPEELITLLNQYLTFATSAIHRYDGTIDKFVGDAVIAFWNAPLIQSNHAYLAARAALELTSGASQFDGIAVGVGIHTDTVFVGNIGAYNQFNYTMIGDGVNITSRLEGLTKFYGVPIVVSDVFVREATKTAAGDNLLFRILDRVRVKGKKQPITIYQLVGNKSDASQEILDTIKTYEQALSYYQHGSWKKAKILAESILVKKPDSPSYTLVQRCKHRVPKNWDGISQMSEK